MRLNYQKPWSCRKKQKDQYYNKQIPLGHWEMSFSLREETVIDWLYLLGPMSVPSASLNLSSIQSSSPAMSFQFSPAKTKKKRNFKILLWGKSSNTLPTQFQNPKQNNKQQKPKSILVEIFKSLLLKSTSRKKKTIFILSDCDT